MKNNLKNLLNDLPIWTPETIRAHLKAYPSEHLESFVEKTMLLEVVVEETK